MIFLLCGHLRLLSLPGIGSDIVEILSKYNLSARTLRKIPNTAGPKDHGWGGDPKDHGGAEPRTPIKFCELSREEMLEAVTLPG